MSRMTLGTLAAVSSVIIGATRSDQIDDNVGAADIELNADSIAAIEAALGNAPGATA